MSPHTTTTTITAYSISARTNIDTVCISVSDQQRDGLTDSSAQCCVLLLSSVFVSVAEGQRQRQVGSEIRALLLFWLTDAPQLHFQLARKRTQCECVKQPP